MVGGILGTSNGMLARLACDRDVIVSTTDYILSSWRLPGPEQMFETAAT